MLLLKISNKTFTQLTILTDREFNAVSYRRSFEEVGECEFTVRLDRAKITTANLEHYNRVEIIEDGIVKFVGIIVRKVVKIDTATIRCRELTYLFKKRILSVDYVANGTIITEVADLLAAVNGVEATGIIAGVVDGPGSVNTTFNRPNPFEVLKQIVKATNNQFKFNPATRTLDVRDQVGTDLSASVIFQYNTTLVSGSNILQFDVEDNGDEITNKVYGKSGAFSSTQTNAGLVTQYGLLEKYKDFRVANTQLVLDDFTNVEITSNEFSPNLDLNPSVEDNFDIGDTVRLIIKNSLIDIDASYQVLEKRVQYSGAQKRISVSINAIPTSLAQKLSDRDYRLELLEKEL